MDQLLTTIAHWLPLIQGFAALASIGGAMLSWRFALRAQRARDQMTRNMVASRLLSTFGSSLTQIKKAQMELLDSVGEPDKAAYRARQQELKHLFELVVAAAAAATPYLAEATAGWSAMLDALAEASIDPKPGNVEAAAKHLMLAAERIRVSATTRELQADHA